MDATTENKASRHYATLARLHTAKAQYRRLLFRRSLFITGLLALLVLLLGLIITLGPLDIRISQVYASLADRLLPGLFQVDERIAHIVWDIRLPRILGALLAGFGLGICGCAMQAVLKNPLASPFTLGISAGAQFGVAVAAVAGIGFIDGPWLLVSNAFVFALLCAAFIIGLSTLRGATSETLVLAGIAINYFFSAMGRLLKYFASDEQLRMMVNWGMGDLAAFSWDSFPMITLAVVLCTPLLLGRAVDLNIMTAGDENARSMGVRANRVRITVMVTASLLVAAVVCFTGTIGFIGLVAPHMTRMIIGADHKWLLPASGLVGAVILTAADAVGMNVIRPTVIPTGIMTSIFGVPFFIWLMLKGKKKEYWT